MNKIRSTTKAAPKLRATRITAVKTTIIIFVLILLLPLAVLATYHIIYYYPISLPEWMHFGTDTQKNLIYYPLSLSSQVYKAQLTNSVDITEINLDVTAYSNNKTATASEIEIKLIESDGDEWINTNSIFLNALPQTTTINITNLRLSKLSLKNSGLMNISQIQISQVQNNVTHGAEIILTKIKLRKAVPPPVLVVMKNKFTGDEFRNKYSKSKNNGTFRIIFLGDSMVKGVSTCNDYNDTEISSSILEEILNKNNGELSMELGKKAFEVLNFGVQRFNAEANVDMYQDLAKEYSPDLIVIFFYFNDYENQKNITAIANRLKDTEKYNQLFQYHDSSLVYNLLFQEASNIYNKEKSYDDTNLSLSVIPQYERLQKLAGNIPIALVAFYDTTSQQTQELREFTEKNKIPLLELNKLPQEYGPKKIYSCPDTNPPDHHPSAYAHQIIAEKLYAFLNEKVRLPS